MVPSSLLSLLGILPQISQNQPMPASPPAKAGSSDDDEEDAPNTPTAPQGVSANPTPLPQNQSGAAMLGPFLPAIAKQAGLFNNQAISGMPFSFMPQSQAGGSDAVTNLKQQLANIQAANRLQAQGKALGYDANGNVIEGDKKENPDYDQMEQDAMKHYQDLMSQSSQVQAPTMRGFNQNDLLTAGALALLGGGSGQAPDLLHGYMQGAAQKQALDNQNAQMQYQAQQKALQQQAQVQQTMAKFYGAENQSQIESDRQDVQDFMTGLNNAANVQDAINRVQMQMGQYDQARRQGIGDQAHMTMAQAETAMQKATSPEEMQQLAKQYNNAAMIYTAAYPELAGTIRPMDADALQSRVPQTVSSTWQNTVTQLSDPITQSYSDDAWASLKSTRDQIASQFQLTPDEEDRLMPLPMKDSPALVKQNATIDQARQRLELTARGLTDKNAYNNAKLSLDKWKAAETNALRFQGMQLRSQEFSYKQMEDARSEALQNFDDAEKTAVQQQNMVRDKALKYKQDALNAMKPGSNVSSADMDQLRRSYTSFNDMSGNLTDTINSIRAARQKFLSNASIPTGSSPSAISGGIGKPISPPAKGQMSPVTPSAIPPKWRFEG